MKSTRYPGAESWFMTKVDLQNSAGGLFFQLKTLRQLGAHMRKNKI